MKSDWAALSRCHRLNAPTLKALREQVFNGTGIIPFVGAGISMDCGFDGWTEFLLRESDRHSKAIHREVDRLMKTQNYEKAAETLVDAMGRRTFNRRIRELYGKSACRAIDVKRQTVAIIPRLGYGPVVTTNFDRLLERAFRIARMPIRKIETGARTKLSSIALDRNRPYLFKVHGDAESPYSRVLTHSEYRSRYGRPRAGRIDIKKPLPRMLASVFSRRPVLFIGCSLVSDRTLAVLRQVRAGHKQMPEHFAFCSARRNGMEKKVRRLRKMGIRAVVYPLGRHDLVRGVLQDLCDGNGMRKPTFLARFVTDLEKGGPLTHRSADGNRRYHVSIWMCGITRAATKAKHQVMDSTVRQKPVESTYAPEFHFEIKAGGNVELHSIVHRDDTKPLAVRGWLLEALKSYYQGREDGRTKRALRWIQNH